MASPSLDFRAFLDALRADNDLVEIDAEVDPDNEVGAVCRKVTETREKAVLFKNVRGAHDGLIQVLGAPGGLRKEGPYEYGRIALHFGLPTTSSAADIIKKALSVDLKKPLPPVIVESGPCKENILTGDQIDLTKIPVPLLHGEDGGRYIQTYGMHILQTPDKSWTNWSIARAMVLDKNRLTGLVAPTQHIGMIHGKWKERNENTPWALAFGAPPSAIAVSGMPIPDYVDENGYVGALAGGPVPLVKCESNDLYVPATSEIILEGYISKNEFADEGPMGEMYGMLFPGKKGRCPVFHVTTITHRNNSILPVAVAGRAPEETHTIYGFLASAAIVQVCQEANLPIKTAWVPHQPHAMWAGLQVDTAALREQKWTREAFCKAVGDVVWKSHAAVAISRLILVGEDIDVFNFDDLLWAYTTRCRPGQDDYLSEDVPGFYLMPFMSHGPGDPFKGGKVVSDALFTAQYEHDKFKFTEAGFRGGYTQEVRDLVNKNWSTKYGFN
ncbi:unnamed protein product [Penicillium olsonii]|uniref:Ferulic acid decarboxylase 1 n=1 Tax=Penicillium olsonii TaxID=99116 RepID=A0A9W4N6I6_PENOL|nr:unnamed protein product [Penicillium olsonii]CAG8301646.1 unnamed protein product [Penicillium olsonii]